MKCGYPEIKKPRFCRGFFLPNRLLYSNSGYVSCLQALRPLGHFERYFIAFSEGFETVAGDGGEMHEYVFAILLLEKTKTLAVIEPFYFTFYHLLTFS